MPRRAAKNVPGTERFRDERRTGGGPRMHARGWHDDETPRELEGDLEKLRNDAVPEAEGGGDRAGMGRQRKTSGTQGRERRKRATPPGKGPKKKAGAGKQAKRGQRA